MYLYKKMTGEVATGLLTCSTPQPESTRIVEINKVEFDTISAKLKADEEAAQALLGPSLKKRVEDLEAYVTTLKG